MGISGTQWVWGGNRPPARGQWTKSYQIKNGFGFNIFGWHLIFSDLLKDIFLLLQEVFNRFKEGKSKI